MITSIVIAVVFAIAFYATICAHHAHQRIDYLMRKLEVPDEYVDPLPKGMEPPSDYESLCR